MKLFTTLSPTLFAVLSDVQSAMELLRYLVRYPAYRDTRGRRTEMGYVGARIVLRWGLVVPAEGEDRQGDQQLPPGHCLSPQPHRQTHGQTVRQTNAYSLSLSLSHTHTHIQGASALREL
eukprot:955219-Rhodomonas_salina.1